MTIRSWILALLLLLPIAGNLTLVGMKELQLLQTPAQRVAIMGYDPRDLLMGHYLLFRLNSPSFSNTERHKYFLPEDDAKILENLLRTQNGQLSIDVHKLSNGKLVFGELYVDNTPWRDFLRQHPALRDYLRK